MTSRERVAAALGHRTPDRTPVFEYVLLPPVAEAILGRPHVDYAGDGAGWQSRVASMGFEPALHRYVRDRLDLAEALGHDMLYVVPNPPPPAPNHPPPPSPVPREDDPVAALLRRVEDASAQPAWPADAELLVYRELKAQMAQRNLDLPLLAPAYMHGVWTDVDLMQTMILAPEVAHRHFRLATQRALAAIDRYVALGIEQIGIGGDFAGTRPLISPQAYRDFILPALQVLGRRIHAAGCHAVNASDGDLWPVIDDFLMHSGVDGYLEIDSHAGMDLNRLKAGFGNCITFYGNMDCGNVLSFATPEAVRRETHWILDDGWGDGGHIFCASNAITASVPFRNYAAMANACAAHFGLAPRLPE